jgi:TPR repeat protein
MKGFDMVIPHLFFFTVFTTVIFTIFIFINNKSKPSKEAAVRAFLVGDYIQAHNNWFNLAKERDDKAQMMLGMSEYMGLNGFKDLDKGNQYAQYTLGKIFEESEEKKDYSQAFKWYEKAAKSGNGFAQYKLGTFFMDGKGVIQNQESAHIWLNLSSSTGNFRANRSRTNLETLLSEEQLALAQKGALRCFVSKYTECP